MNASEPPSGAFHRVELTGKTESVAVTDALELTEAPHFVSWPPRLPLEMVVKLSQALLEDRAKSGRPPHYSTPVPAEFILDPEP